MEAISMDKIKSTYPNQWVLLGNAKMRDDNFVGAVIQKILNGVVIYNSKDKRERAYKINDLKKGFTKVACIFIGELPKNQKFWL